MKCQKDSENSRQDLETFEDATWRNVCGTEMLVILSMVILTTIFTITLARISNLS